MRFQLSLNKTLCPILPPFTDKEQKLKKCLVLFPCLFSTQSLRNRNWKANKYSILTETEIEPPVSEFLNRILKFYAPTDSEHKFHKTGIANWLPIGFNLGSSWLGTRSHTFTLCLTTNQLMRRVLRFYIPIHKLLE